MRPLMTVLTVAAVLVLSGCGGGDEPEATPATSSATAEPSAPESSAAETSAAEPSGTTTPGEPEFCAVAAEDSLDTAQPGTQEYADGTAALDDAAPEELKESTAVLRTLGEVQLGLGTDGTPEELQAAMEAEGVAGPALIAAFSAVGEYIDTCDL